LEAKKDDGAAITKRKKLPKTHNANLSTDKTTIIGTETHSRNYTPKVTKTAQTHKNPRTSRTHKKRNATLGRSYLIRRDDQLNRLGVELSNYVTSSQRIDPSQLTMLGFRLIKLLKDFNALHLHVK